MQFIDPRLLMVIVPLFGVLEVIFVFTVTIIALINQRRGVKAQEEMVRLQREQIALLQKITKVAP